MAQLQAAILVAATGLALADSVDYLMAGEGVGCSDYDGYEEITTEAECVQAASYLDTDCQTAAVISSTLYPRNCYYNMVCTIIVSTIRIWFIF